MKKKKFDPQNLTGRKRAAKTTQMKRIVFHTKGRMSPGAQKAEPKAMENYPQSFRRSQECPTSACSDSRTAIN